MSAYTEFVKAHYAKVKHLPAKERFAELGKMWAKQKGGKGGKMLVTGGAVTGGAVTGGAITGGKEAKAKSKKAKAKKEEGAGFLDDFKTGFEMPFQVLGSVL